MLRWHVCKNKTLESKPLTPNVMQLAHKIEEKIYQWLKSYPLQGKPHLHYINEQFLDDTNDKTSFVYIGVQGVTI